jgi:hypothetical protein
MIDRTSFALANLTARRSRKSLATRPKVAFWRRFAFGPQSLLFGLRVDLFADQIEPSARLVACGVDR